MTWRVTSVTSELAGAQKELVELPKSYLVDVQCQERNTPHLKLPCRSRKNIISVRHRPCLHRGDVVTRKVRRELLKRSYSRIHRNLNLYRSGLRRRRRSRGHRRMMTNRWGLGTSSLNLNLSRNRK